MLCEWPMIYRRFHICLCACCYRSPSGESSARMSIQPHRASKDPRCAVSCKLDQRTDGAQDQVSRLYDVVFCQNVIRTDRATLPLEKYLADGKIVPLIGSSNLQSSRLTVSKLTGVYLSHNKGSYKYRRKLACTISQHARRPRHSRASRH